MPFDRILAVGRHEAEAAAAMRAFLARKKLVAFHAGVLLSTSTAGTLGLILYADDRVPGPALRAVVTR